MAAPAIGIAGLEARAMNAWPALRSVMVGGWACRFAGGYTKRANSISALEPVGDFDAVRRESAALYAAEGLPAIFRLSPLAPPGCDAALDALGYRAFDPSLVLTAPIIDSVPVADVAIAEAPAAAWLDGFARANGVATSARPVHDRIIAAIRHPAAFATLTVDGAPIGFGLAVREAGMVGLFDIVVAPAARGRGLGAAIVRALLAWGRSGGAAHAYLQVRAENAPARALYARLGFAEAYRYHYRLPPD